MLAPSPVPSKESFDPRTTRIQARTGRDGMHARRRRITPVATPAVGGARGLAWSPAAFVGGCVLEHAEAIAPSRIRPSAGARLTVLGRYLGPAVPALRCDVDLGRTFELGQSTVLLSGDASVRGRHARITPRGSDVVLEGVEGSRGTFVRMQAPRRLCDGDRFRVGRRLLVFRTRTDRRVGLRSHTMAAIEPMAWGRLDVIEGDRITQTPALVGDEIGIGRDRGGIVFDDDAFVSRAHCRLRRLHGRVVLDDLGSCNGTFVELTPAPQVLPYGSVLMFGQTLVRIDPIL